MQFRRAGRFYHCFLKPSALVRAFFDRDKGGELDEREFNACCHSLRLASSPPQVEPEPSRAYAAAEAVCGWPRLGLAFSASPSRANPHRSQIVGLLGITEESPLLPFPFCRKLRWHEVPNYRSVTNQCAPSHHFRGAVRCALSRGDLA